MKKMMIIGLFLFATSFSFAQCEDPGMATVKSQGGFDIYLFSEPSAEYEEVFEMKNALGIMASLAESNFTIVEQVDLFVNQCRKKNKKADKKGEPKAQAIIIYNNERAVGIAYK